jgi:hypothetical protein
MEKHVSVKKPPFMVFKTSVTTIEEAAKLKKAFDALVGRGYWNFALDDTDKILRIASERMDSETAHLVMSSYGFECEELED